jgi:hypothetical protein
MGRFLVPLVLALAGIASADKTSLDCPLRQIGLDYAASLQPFRSAAAFEEVADALNGAIEAANCSVSPKARAGGAASGSRVAWAPLPRAGSGVASVFADPTSKGSDQGCRPRGSRGSHRTPSHPVEDSLDPPQIGKVP